MIIDPQGLTPVEWCDRMVNELKTFGQFQVLTPSGNWQDWATQLLYQPKLDKFKIPHPQDFSSFEEWAMRFNEVVQIK